jgi:hypothetical protein
MGISGQFYPLEGTPRYPLNRRIGGPQSWSGHRTEEKSFASAEDRTPVVIVVIMIQFISFIIVF